MAEAFDDDEGAPGYLERQERKARRMLERKWAAMAPISANIRVSWDKPPVRGQESELTAEIGGEEYHNTFALALENGPEVKQYGFNGAAERWCTWKWHTARGTPVDEHTGRVILEPGYKPPKFEWAEEELVAFTPRTRGPNKPKEATV